MSIDLNKVAKQLKVAKKIQETADAVTLELAIPSELNEQYKYKAGQFITFFLPIGEAPLARSYSLCTAPETDANFAVTIKKVPGGKGSTFLVDQVKAGDTLWTSPPSGFFFKSHPVGESTEFILFGAGSGITPLLSIIKHVLNARKNDRVTLFYGNRTETSIIFFNELAQLTLKFPDRLRVQHVLSKPSASWKGHQGRLDKTKTLNILKETEWKAVKRVSYICGPDEFMENAKQGLLSWGFPKDDIHIESFTGTSSAPATFHSHTSPAAGAKAQIFIGDEPPNSETCTELTFTLDKETKTVPCEPGRSILDVLLDAGINAPFSCMSGSCMACMGRLQEGVVYQEDAGILSEDNVERLECLTCQAKPRSGKVKITYDGVQ